MYAFGTYEGFYSTQIHVFMEGTGMYRSKIRTYYGSTGYAWLPATLSIKGVENLKVIKCTIIILTFVRINHSYFILYGFGGLTNPLHPLRIWWLNHSSSSTDSVVKPLLFILYRFGGWTTLTSLSDLVVKPLLLHTLKIRWLNHSYFILYGFSG